MPKALDNQKPEFRAAFLANEQQERVHNGKVAAALVFALMPAGITLDLVYIGSLYSDPHQRRHIILQFLMIRLASSLLAAGLWFLHRTAWGRKNYKLISLPIALLPALCITWMIYATEGPDSPYYAGLNLILLAVSVVAHWTIPESVTAVLSVIGMYLVACVIRGVKQGDFPNIYNNVYFLTLTGIIVITGNYFFNRLRHREFSLRYQLDENKKTLEENNKKLKELDEVKSRFFANISHELRTPLTLLLAPLENLLQRFKLDPETNNLLSMMHSNGMRLLKLINDLLDLVRLESGVMQVKAEPLALGEFIQGMASAARQMADDKRITLETVIASEVGVVMADRDKLEKIVLNLQFNALKFTPSGGRVEISAIREADELVIAVKDTGMGISSKNLPNIFSRFWQADDSSRRKYQGVGIGLALVKELTEVQGGKASVASEEGKGTTFTIRLPFKRAEKVEVSPSELQIANGSNRSNNNSGSTVGNQEWLTGLYRRAELFPSMTSVQEAIRPTSSHVNGSNLPSLLVADDEPDMLRFLSSQLEKHYKVYQAVDGQQAIDKASQFLPDIILLDMMMPEKDGLQACKEIRERTPTTSIPIILLTARADEETKLAALKAGASDFLPKPFSTTELHVRIKNLVESFHYQRKLSKQNTVLENTIEQLKETESQLVQTEKLASLGRMSAGIIHEINNPLNFATTGLYTLRNKSKFIAPEQQEEYTEILKDVEDGIKRVKNIVSDLRMFTHPDTDGRDQVEVSEVVAAALRFLSGELRGKVNVEKQLTEHQIVWANKSKLIQVLTNLIQNSCDAMKDKVYSNDEKPTIRIEGRVEKDLSLISVRDNGTGIDSEHIGKIFDPFYTTKDVGEGMGLGLSICYRIVQECDGRIEVKTEPGKFCQFILEFPLKY
jgi:signal transduction histidine kinase